MRDKLGKLASVTTMGSLIHQLNYIIKYCNRTCSLRTCLAPGLQTCYHEVLIINLWVSRRTSCIGLLLQFKYCPVKTLMQHAAPALQTKYLQRASKGFPLTPNTYTRMLFVLQGQAVGNMPVFAGTCNALCSCAANLCG